MSAAAVVPYRVDADGERRRNAEIVLGWLDASGVRPVLAEHSAEPDDAIRLPASAMRVHVPSAGGPFNKALACNAGFVASRSEVIALVDADTLVGGDALLDSIVSVRERADVVRPFGRLVELDETATVAVAGGSPLPHAESGRSDARDGEGIPLCGGIVVMRASVYEDVGGMDTAFAGWGGEDDALSAALMRSGKRCGIFHRGVAFHLAHARTVRSRYGHPDYPANFERAGWWHEASMDDLAEAMTRGRLRLRAAMDR